MTIRYLMKPHGNHTHKKICSKYTKDIEWNQGRPLLKIIKYQRKTEREEKTKELEDNHKTTK